MRDQGLHLCLVDDDSVYQFIAKRMVETIDRSHRFTTFSNGQEALNYLLNNCNCRESIPDLIFLDLNMPIMNGWEFLKQFSSVKGDLCKAAAIYIVSSSLQNSDRQKAKEFSSVMDYLCKPLEKNDLHQILDKHIYKQVN